jgi:hypothetical protein
MVKHAKQLVGEKWEAAILADDANSPIPKATSLRINPASIRQPCNQRQRLIQKEGAG